MNLRALMEELRKQPGCNLADLGNLSPGADDRTGPPTGGPAGPAEEVCTHAEKVREVAEVAGSRGHAATKRRTAPSPSHPGLRRQPPTAGKMATALRGSTARVRVGELSRRATAGGTGRCRRRASRPPDVENLEINAGYRQVRKLIDDGQQLILVTGGAGTGKTMLIRYLQSVLRKKTVVAAPTGIAALNAGGVTIHSFFRFPPRIVSAREIQRLPDRKLYGALELLIVDEVSMVRCDVMDAMDRFLRLNRDSPEPFGGVQVLLIGDLYQLPPVVTPAERPALQGMGYTDFHFFCAHSLEEASLAPVELKTVYRQADPEFVQLLNRIRVGGDVDRAVGAINDACCGRELDRQATILTCTNADADRVNVEQLNGLPGRGQVFRGRLRGRFAMGEDRLPAPMNLHLKAGARVMLTQNDPEGRWVNGTLAVVSGLGPESVQVRLMADPMAPVHDVERATWETHRYEYDPEADEIVAKVIGEYVQFPLMVAWAVTIHKSQGKTLDRLRIDLGRGAFAPGQTYVALSRCRSLEGIGLARPIRDTDVRCDPVIKRFYEALEDMSRGASGG